MVARERRHFRIHKVIQRPYFGEEENAYMILRQIYSRNYVPHIIRIARVLQKILQKTFRSPFSWHSVVLQGYVFNSTLTYQQVSRIHQTFHHQ